MISKIKFLSTVSACWLLSMVCIAQTPEWWSDNVGWDGVTAYQHYLELTPTGMGPNAMPVPDLHQQWDTLTSFTLSGMSHFREGEITLNADMDLRWQPSSWVRLRIHLVPLEWYQTSHSLKTLRRVHFLSYDQQWAGGDIYVESAIRIPQEWTPGIKTELRVGVKTASGTNLGAARFTDTPGYFFDLDVAGNLKQSPAWDWEAMLGFYAYQTYEDDHRQNDCVLFGGSVGWSRSRWSIRGEMRGYWGYLQDNDHPVLAQLETRWGEVNGPWQLIVKASTGILDWPYTSFQCGVRRVFFLGK
ncbi:MAG: hypothetical protein K9I85_00195 [Saprospiraceae bacterium]|nr:hypothetical protein [Saprospiraceae bacterium]